MTQPVPENVQQAAIALDNECPDWYEKINLDKLDMGDSDYCVMGQVFKGEGYHSAIVRIFGKFVSGIFSSYDDEWKEEILARRETMASDDIFVWCDGDPNKQSQINLYTGNKILNSNFSTRNWYKVSFTPVFPNVVDTAVRTHKRNKRIAELQAELQQLLQEQG